MSDVSERFQFPYIMPQQAQKHVTHNEAIRMLDALLHAHANSRQIASPPANPQPGDSYIVPANAQGDWSGKQGQLAAWQDGAWTFFEPQKGLLCLVLDESKIISHDGASWHDMPVGFENLPDVGIGTDASAGNSLTVSGDGTLLTHGALADDHRLSINKSGDTATAAVLFQSQWSGRAEIGLAGNNRFSIKTSTDGNTWSESFVIDPDNNSMTLNGNLIADGDVRGERLSARSSAYNYLITTIDNDHADPVSSSVQFSFNGTRQFSFGANKQSKNFSVTTFDSNGAWKGNAFYIEQAEAGSMNNALYISRERNVGIGTVPGCELDVAGKVRLRPQSMDTLPPAASSLSGTLAFVNDSAGGPKLAMCDGMQWLCFEMSGMLG